MSGSSFGKQFVITTWGESHGKGIGVVVDGCPAGLAINEEMIQRYLDRRKPGTSRITTKRKESDSVEILSGVFEGKTTGTSISMIVYNENERPGDYSEIANCYRPGHADYTYDKKYGFRDYRGGGRSSGRETIGRVAGGAIASEILKQLGIKVLTYAKAIGPITIDYNNFNKDEILNNPAVMPDAVAAEKAVLYLEEQIKQLNSTGGLIECVVTGMPAGIGEPVFEKLDANLAKAVMSVGAVKGVEIGDGFLVATKRGTENNDGFMATSTGDIIKKTNHSGGVLGGLSDGSDLIIRAAVKPTPSIYSTQDTVNKEGENIKINIKGRHDPIVVPRAVVVVESMVALTIVDLLFANMSTRMDKIKEFYQPPM